MAKHLSPLTGVGIPVLHDWAVDGWTPFTSYLVTPQGSATITKAVTTAFRGRITGQAAATDGDRRDFHIRSDTLSVNSRVRATWWGSNVYDGTATPQMGICQRFTDLGGGSFIAVVITNNIYLTDPNYINVSLWQSNGTTITIGDVVAQKNFGSVLNRTLSILSAERYSFGSWINGHTVQPWHLYGMAAGDLVDVVSTDTTFNATAVAVNGADSSRGSISHIEPTTLSTQALKTDAGTITPAKQKRYWPMELVSELIGTTLRLKVWRYMDEEPDWGSAANVLTVDMTASTNLTEPTGAGLSGLVSAHLRSSAYEEYGRLEFTKLP